MSAPTILYGVQGTGNGHLSRARLMAREFHRAGVNVEFLFSGREPDNYFDMQSFKSRRFVQGLSFTTLKGKLSRWGTLRDARTMEFFRDLYQLDLRRYDMVITDFEPVAAWAARLKQVRSIGIGHQYAFGDNTPAPEGDPAAKFLLRNYAPVQDGLGLHWQRYENDTLPPMIDTELDPSEMQDFTLIYLPFEALNDTLHWLRGLPNERFEVFSPAVSEPFTDGKIQVNPLSHTHFQTKLKTCRRIVCNAGFELISEALFLGTPVLTKPLHAQYEQLANVCALEASTLANTTKDLDTDIIANFINHTPERKRQLYPNVAAALVDYLINNDEPNAEELSTSLWQKHIEVVR